MAKYTYNINRNESITLLKYQNSIAPLKIKTVFIRPYFYKIVLSSWRNGYCCII